MSTDPYGYDTACTSDYFAGRTSFGVKQCREHCYRALTTTQGSCPGQGTARSLNLIELYGEALTRGELARIQSQVRAVVMDDDRVRAATIRASSTQDGTSWTLTISIGATLRDGSGFRLILATSGLTVTMLDQGLT